MIQTIRSPISPKSQSSKLEAQHSNHSNHSNHSSESNDDHIREILDSAEKWITQQLLFHEYVTAFDLLEQFDVPPKLARMLITRFEKRTSTYAIYPLSMDSTIPRSSLQPLERMLASNTRTNTTTTTNTINIDEFNFDDREELINNDRNYVKINHTASNSDSSTHSFQSQQSQQSQHSHHSHHSREHSQTKSLMKPSTSSNNKLYLEPTLSDLPTLSPSVSPRIYTNPYDYIDYKKQSFDTWFSREKHQYIISIQECAASYNIGLPEFIAEMIVINSVLLPGCYTLTGLLFPAARNEADLFAEYANKENGYITNKTERGIAYKRKKPMINVRRPENNTASLWLDEDGSICGFRCIWVHGIRGKLMVDQKFCVLNGCWTLSGEITITFEQWDVEDEFEGYLETETFCGRWTAGKELYGEFQWFITTIESFYLNHNIPINQDGNIITTGVDIDGNTLYQQTRLGFHDSMGVSMEDEFDLEDDILMSPISNNANIKITDPTNILINKIFDIEINESLTITAKFLKNNNVLEISEKQDINDITNIVSSSASSTDSFDDENEIIGYGKWYRNGKMSFKNVKYIDQKLLLSFDGCCDGKKVLGRLCIYHDNTTDIDKQKEKMNKKLSKTNTPNTDNNYHDGNDLDDDDEDDDIDDFDDDDQFFGLSHVNRGDFDDDDSDDDDDDDDTDDDERISFIQMIIVSNIIPA